MSKLTREETTKLYLEKNDDYSKIPIKRGSGEGLEVGTVFRSERGWYYVKIGENIHVANPSLSDNLVPYKSPASLVDDGWIID